MKILNFRPQMRTGTSFPSKDWGASEASSSLEMVSPPRNSSEIARSGEIIVVADGGSLNSAVSAHSSPDRHLEQQELSDAFKLMDVNEDGKISPSELGSILSSLGYASSDDELRLILDAVDTDGDGFIDLQEFINHNVKMDKAGSDSPTRTRELRAAFNVFDIDKNNFISAEELHQVLKGLGEKSTIEDCSRMIRGVDSDGDGQVNFEEFERMMRTTSVH